MQFRNRQHAGEHLAGLLGAYANREDVVVLGLPRGGVPVAFEVARALRAPLDVFVVRKLGAPGHEEFAVGAIAAGGVRVLNDDALQWMRVSPDALDAITAREQRELERRERAYRGERGALSVHGKTVLLVDDGLATGASMRAAARAVRALGPARVVAAVPVGAADTCLELQRETDAVVCAARPEPFHAVGLWYERFDQTSDDEVRACLAEAAAWRGGAGP